MPAILSKQINSLLNRNQKVKRWRFYWKQPVSASAGLSWHMGQVFRTAGKQSKSVWLSHIRILSSDWSYSMLWNTFELLVVELKVLKPQRPLWTTTPLLFLLLNSRHCSKKLSKEQKMLRQSKSQVTQLYMQTKHLLTRMEK